MKKFFITWNLTYFIIFWVGVGLISIDEHVVLGATYVLYIMIGVFINTVLAMVWGDMKDKKDKK